MQQNANRLLPEEMAYHMFFGFKGGGIEGSSNGTVMLSSQLRPEAHEEARSVRGYDETHTGILRSAAVAERLNRLLAEVQ